MLHIAFYAKLGEEKGTFTMTDILKGICQKLIYRHPHVFGNVEVEDDKEVIVKLGKLKIPGTKGLPTSSIWRT